MGSRTIPVVDAANADLSALGSMIDASRNAPPRISSFYGEAVKLWPAPFESDADTTLVVARISPRPTEVIYLERHFKHTQAFIPLGGKPFIAVMSPPTAANAPSLEDIKAYRFDGSAGFLMRVGTWHEFPFATLPETDIVVILRNETNRNLESAENGEALGSDLEKRNIKARLGVTLAFEIPVP
jgi:ureidoglycolate lyase